MKSVLIYLYCIKKVYYFNECNSSLNFNRCCCNRFCIKWINIYSTNVLLLLFWGLKPQLNWENTIFLTFRQLSADIILIIMIASPIENNHENSVLKIHQGNEIKKYLFLWVISAIVNFFYLLSRAFLLRQWFYHESDYTIRIYKYFKTKMTCIFYFCTNHAHVITKLHNILRSNSFIIKNLKNRLINYCSHECF